MARDTSASGSYIQVASGAVSSFTYGTMVAIGRRTSGDGFDQILLQANNPANSAIRFGLGIVSDTGSVRASFGSSFTAAATSVSLVSQGWFLAAASKASGNANVSLAGYRYATDAWLTGTGAQNADTTADSTSIVLGADSTSGGNRLRGVLAAAAVFANRVLTTAELERLPYSLASWLALAPSAMWVLDQQATSQPVLDWMGGGANESATANTVVSTVSTAIFSYGHPIIGVTRSGAGGPATVNGTAVASLGGLTATIAGTRTVLGAAAASLGFTSTVTGRRTTAGSGAATLGGLTATAAGTRATAGTAAAALGGLTGTANGYIQAPPATPTAHTNQTPASGDIDNAAPITTGVRFMVDSEVDCTGIAFWVPTTNTGTYTVGLYQTTADDDPTGSGTGTELATASVLAVEVTPDDWAQALFDEPVTLSPGVVYTAARHASSGHYVATTSVFDDGPITNGGVSLLESGPNPNPPGLGVMRNGVFDEGADLAYPADFFGQPDYFTDVVLAAGGEVTGTATANLGGLTATASGTRVVVGQAAANLGALTGTAAGLRTVNGAAVATLGGLTAAGAGVRTVKAVGTASIGGLTATASGLVTTAGSAAATFSLTAAAAGTRRTFGTAAALLGGLSATASGGTEFPTIPGVHTAAGRTGTLTGAGRAATLTSGGRP